MRRRRISSPGVVTGWPPAGESFAPRRARGTHERTLAPREIAADVVIVGGGLGGCAAALAVLAERPDRRPHRID